MHPKESGLAKRLAPLFAHIGEFSFPLSIAEKNSNQFSFEFDQSFEERLLALGASKASLSLPKEVIKKHDFAFNFAEETVVVEVEKSNSEKILYDFMKFHVYLRHGATAAVLVLPCNWPHRGGVVNMFQKAKQRYELCREHRFGSTEFFEKCLIVGYDQTHSDGRKLTRDLRTELIAGRSSEALNEGIREQDSHSASA